MFGIKNFAGRDQPAAWHDPRGRCRRRARLCREAAQIKTGQFMTVTLSCDHRAVDGALGAELLGVFKALIENPVMTGLGLCSR